MNRARAIMFRGTLQPGEVFTLVMSSEAALAFLEPLAHHLGDYGAGSPAGIFDGDPLFSPRGCIAQAWSVPETLRARVS